MRSLGSDADEGMYFSSSSGVCGLLEDVRDVPSDVEGAGVEVEVDAKGGGDETGGGVTDTDRCIVAMCMAGRARQKDEAVVVDVCIFGGALELAI